MAIKHQYPGVGLGNVGSYQVSGRPFITGSETKNGQEVKVSFPKVTKSVTVIASGSAAATLDDNDSLHVSFASSASSDNSAAVNAYAKNYITLGDGDAVTFNVKCKEIYISCAAVQADGATPIMGYELFAELTNIPTSSMYILTGSGISGHTL